MALLVPAPMAALGQPLILDAKTGVAGPTPDGAYDHEPHRG
jgi:hypothetical protein